MYYESEMMNETLDSIYSALKAHTPKDLKIRMCLNSQTYIEEPEVGEAIEMFDMFLNHKIFKEFNVEIVHKTNDDPFYNIADWRREEYDPSAKYTVWGESDCLLPIDFFYILDSLNIEVSHLLTFASRPMWDTSWQPVVHKELRNYSAPCQCKGDHRPDCVELIEAPLKYKDIINQQQLDEFNNKFEIEIEQVPLKIDGSLVCISYNYPHPFIPQDMHFVREDSCLEHFSRIKHLPQFCVSTRLKGHNYKKDNKRTNTKATREDAVFKQYAEKSQNAMVKFLQQL